MNRLLLFNPENDLALASFSPHFTPPAAAMKLAAAGASLPVWYGSQGDCVIASSGHQEYFEYLSQCFDFGVSVVSEIPVDIEGCSPWGWSPYARTVFNNLGCTGKLLPDDDLLESVKELSHRRLTLDIYNQLQDSGMLPYPLPLFPIEVYDIKVIEHMLLEREHIFLKSPLSGSGRGILDSATAPVHQVLRLASGIIRRQGSIMVEPALEKRCDFAMLFDMVDGEAVYIGLSCFFNASYSTYSGNLLMPEHMLGSHIVSCGIPPMWLDATREAMTRTLGILIGKRYNGPLGVDMMVYRDSSGKMLIAPCVEVNLRYTMGRVAHIFNHRYMHHGSSGVMSICRDVGSSDFKGLPKVFDGRLSDGCVSLTPPGYPFAVIVKAHRDV
ncbi:MAG: hypothetical protein NC082_04445 [Clostridiales bacterium]|nr:hypothetical protein [Clostridiales bacterium]